MNPSEQGRVTAVLIVEDNESALQSIKKKFEHISERRLKRNDGSAIEVDGCGDLETARRMIEDRFYDVAIIDLGIPTKPPVVRGDSNKPLQQDVKPETGIKLLAMLQKERPSCVRVVFTISWPQKDEIKILEQFTPGIATAQHILPKLSENLDKYTDNLICSLPNWHLSIDGIDRVYELLHSQGVLNKHDIIVGGKRPPRVKTTRDELVYLMTKLFRFTDEVKDEDREDHELREKWGTMEVSRVELVPMDEQGKSKTAVFKALPKSSPNPCEEADLTLCVVKIGRVSQIAKEVDNFNRYVRFSLSDVRRVELLSYAKADTIAALCYSFAGKGSGDLFSLATALEYKDPRVCATVMRLFDPDPKKKHWFRNPKRGPVLKSLEKRLGYFINKDVKHKIDDFRTLGIAVVELIQREKPEAGAKWLDVSDAFGEIRLDGRQVIRVPRSYLHARPWWFNRSDYLRCIVHGDLNANNVILNGLSPRDYLRGLEAGVADDAAEGLDAIRIDFCHTGIGPVAHDFAKLEASVRLTTQLPYEGAASLTSDEALGILFCADDEREAWTRAWGGNSSQSAEMSYWAQVSKTLQELVRRTFYDEGSAETQLTAEEYASTCLACAFSELNWISSKHQILRMMVWISELLQHVNLAGGG
jgi:hypothetical protein